MLDAGEVLTLTIYTIYAYNIEQKIKIKRKDGIDSYNLLILV